jgi:hypothetical protein
MNRRRISTSFLSIKVFLLSALIFWLCISLGNMSYRLPIKLLLILLALMVFSSCWYLISLRKVIYYDGENFYISCSKNIQEFKVALKNIDKVQFSIIGLNLLSGYNFSYKITYHDLGVKSFRIFPRTWSNDMDKVVEQIRVKNPKVEVCNWSLGLNELFR